MSRGLGTGLACGFVLGAGVGWAVHGRTSVGRTVPPAGGDGPARVVVFRPGEPPVDLDVYRWADGGTAGRAGRPNPNPDAPSWQLTVVGRDGRKAYWIGSPAAGPAE